MTGSNGCNVTIQTYYRTGEYTWWSVTTLPLSDIDVRQLENRPPHLEPEIVYLASKLGKKAFRATFWYSSAREEGNERVSFVSSTEVRFFDSALAARVTKAFAHVARLCGADQPSNEPF
jgi:hypothetical protein